LEGLCAVRSTKAVRFVLRWPKEYGLIDEQERYRKAWEISRLWLTYPPPFLLQLSLNLG
jgi:hypothetical protein